jgi:histidyl-tRNA synthetase
MIKAITGTKDILPSEISKWYFLENTVRNIFVNYNYKEIRTPVFEETLLFARSIGEETDIVGKEMYSFVDRSDTSITLKPEMTAGVVRAFIEHSLGKQLSLNKLFYIAPMFRQEKPQAGRLRQFHQFGGEVLGSKSMTLDAELIGIAFFILKDLGLKDLTVKINTMGVPEERAGYRMILREYLQDKKNDLSEDSRKRFETNILRIFDSKVESDREIMKNAPLLIDHIEDEGKEDFEKVKELLNKLSIPYIVDPTLVRGLDYYTKTTFEIISGKVGSQSALVGGGRYDLLVEQLGGNPTPGVGFAAGIERILLACENENSLNIPADKIDLYIVQLDKGLTNEVVFTALGFRQKNLSVDFDYLDRSVKAQMREANKLNARYVLFLGGEEYKFGKVNLKNMKSGEQKEFSLKAVDEMIKTIS